MGTILYEPQKPLSFFNATGVMYQAETNFCWFQEAQGHNVSFATFEQLSTLKCFRYRKFLRMVEEGVSPANPSIVPDPTEGYDRAYLLPSCRVAPDRVFLCRKVYESRQKRLLKNPLWKKFTCSVSKYLCYYFSLGRKKVTARNKLYWMMSFQF